MPSGLPDQIHAQEADNHPQLTFRQLVWFRSTIEISILAVYLWFIFSPELAGLWGQWTSDALRSIGLLIPPVSFWLCIRVWNEHQPIVQHKGSWWGLLPLTLAMLGGWLRIFGEPGIGIPGGALALLPIGLLIWAYVSGAIVLFKGIAVYKKVFFPVGILLFVNPMPAFIPGAIDLQLQAIGASAAQATAKLLDLPLSAENLQLMFTPQLGMFIAPGCDGLRGAVSMGLIALVLGHLHKMRLPQHFTYVAVAVLLGYLFNLFRLCALTICYGAALHLHWLAMHMEAADYVIGASLFALAAAYLFAAKLFAIPSQSRESAGVPAGTVKEFGVTKQVIPSLSIDRDSAHWVWKVLAVLIIGGAISGAIQILLHKVSGPIAFAEFPDQINDFQIVNRWTHSMQAGITETGAEYQSGAVSAYVASRLGGHAEHNPIACYVARGEVRRWLGMHTVIAAGKPVIFELALTKKATRGDDGLQLIGATECHANDCRETRPISWQDWLKHPTFLSGMEPTSPLLLIVSEPANDDASDEQAQETRMIQFFDSFASKVDFGSIRAYVASESK